MSYFMLFFFSCLASCFWSTAVALPLLCCRNGLMRGTLWSLFPSVDTSRAHSSPHSLHCQHSGSFKQRAGTGPFPAFVTHSQDSAVHPVRQSGFPGTPQGCLMTMPVTLRRVSQQLRSAKHPVPAPRGAGAPAASQSLLNACSHYRSAEVFR